MDSWKQLDLIRIANRFHYIYRSNLNYTKLKEQKFRALNLVEDQTLIQEPQKTTIQGCICWQERNILGINKKSGKGEAQRIMLLLLGNIELPSHNSRRNSELKKLLGTQENILQEENAGFLT